MPTPEKTPAPTKAASNTPAANTPPEKAPAKKAAAKTPPAGTLVLLVRHGTTPTTGQVLPGRAAGLHLADKGREQAETVAARLAGWTVPAGDSNGKPASKDGPARRIAAVYTSPLERTRETAAPIARALGLRPTVERGLLECDFGEWTGAKLKELMKKPEWSTVQRYPSGFRFPGGESFTAMQARIVTAIAEIARRHPGEAVVAVSHADPIKAAVADALGSHLDLFQRIVVSPCSVTAIAYSALGPTVLTVNSTSALTELMPS